MSLHIQQHVHFNRLQTSFNELDHPQEFLVATMATHHKQMELT